MKIILLMFTLFFLSPVLYSATLDGLNEGYPTIPPDFEVLIPGKQVAKASVNFDSSTPIIGETNGYTVTDPFGNTFVVDNIDNPTYAFYGTYVEPSDNLTVFDTPKVNSQVYVEEINFGNF